MYLKIEQKLRCLGCISKQTMRSTVKRTRLNSSKDHFYENLPFLHKEKTEHSFELSLSMFVF